MLKENQKEIEKELRKEKLKEHLMYVLINYRGEQPILIDSIESDLLKEILFKKTIESVNGNLVVKYSLRKGYNNLYKKIDFSNVSFDDVEVCGNNFDGWINVSLNPQKVYQKNLSYTKLKGVIIRGPFKGCFVHGMDTTGSIGSIICTETIALMDLAYTVLTDAIVIGSFDNIDTEGMITTGCIKRDSADIINFQKRIKTKKKYNR